MEYYIGQALSIIAMALMIYSFQIKSNKYLYIVQLIAHVGFATSYLLLGHVDACVFNLLSLLRCVLFLIPKLKGNVFVIIGLEILFVISTIFTYSSLFSILIMIATMAGTYALWTNNGKTIRLITLCVVSPFWLINNIYVFSIGGIICETFNIISIIVSLFRFRKEGFEK